MTTPGPTSLARSVLARVPTRVPARISACALLALAGCNSGPARTRPVPTPPIQGESGARTTSLPAVLDLADVFERVSPTVVTLHVVLAAGAVNEDGQVLGSAETGSGVVVAADGTILTAAHVVELAESVQVTFPTGETSPAEVVKSDPSADLAVVRATRAPRGGFQVAPLGPSDRVRVGEPVFVVGAPLGATHTLTVGHVSARRVDPRERHGLHPVEYLQTDAAISPGNSGGPMFDLDGRVIGIVSHILSLSGGNEGLGFAVTSRQAAELMADRSRGWVGLEVVDLTPRLRTALNLAPDHGGYLVQYVAPGSLADRVGLRGGTVEAVVDGQPVLLGGDVILEVLGVPCQDPTRRAEIRARTSSLEAGQDLTVEVLRQGRVQELRTTL